MRGGRWRLLSHRHLPVAWGASPCRQPSPQAAFPRPLSTAQPAKPRPPRDLATWWRCPRHPRARHRTGVCASAPGPSARRAPEARAGRSCLCGGAAVARAAGRGLTRQARGPLGPRGRSAGRGAGRPFSLAACPWPHGRLLPVPSCGLLLCESVSEARHVGRGPLVRPHGPFATCSGRRPQTQPRSGRWRPGWGRSVGPRRRLPSPFVRGTGPGAALGPQVARPAGPASLPPAPRGCPCRPQHLVAADFPAHARVSV